MKINLKCFFSYFYTISLLVQVLVVIKTMDILLLLLSWTFFGVIFVHHKAHIPALECLGYFCDTDSYFQ